MKKVILFVLLLMVSSGCAAQSSTPRVSLDNDQTRSIWNSLLIQTPDDLAWNEAFIGEDRIVINNNRYLITLNIREGNLEIGSIYQIDEQLYHSNGTVNRLFLPNNDLSKLLITDIRQPAQVSLLNLERGELYDIYYNEHSNTSSCWSQDGSEIAILENNVLSTIDVGKSIKKKKTVNIDVNVNTVLGMYEDSWILGEKNSYGDYNNVTKIGRELVEKPVSLNLSGKVSVDSSGILAADNTQINVVNGGSSSIDIPKGYHAIEAQDGRILFASSDLQRCCIWGKSIGTFLYCESPVNSLDDVSPNGSLEIKLYAEGQEESFGVYSGNKQIMEFLPPKQMKKPFLLEEKWIDDNTVYVLWVPNNNQQYEGLVLSIYSIDKRQMMELSVKVE